MSSKRKTIAVSAVSSCKGGALTISQDCLHYLSALATDGNYRVIALVHKRELADYPHTEYIEMPDVIKGWGRRLWCEYVTVYKLSQKIMPVHLWLSLHDATPRVVAERRVAYCQTPLLPYKWSWRDFLFDYRAVLFVLFTRWVYRINVHRNTYLIVQQEWLRSGLSRMLGVKREKSMVALPERKENDVTAEIAELPCFTFFYATTPDCHKNSKLLCDAISLLEQELGKGRSKVVLTISGQENKYVQWLYKKFDSVSSIGSVRFTSREKLFDYYHAVSCLVFPSKVETWGLPVSEFMVTGKPMLLAGPPYVHGTAVGSIQTAFFKLSDPVQLMNLMERLCEDDFTFLTSISTSDRRFLFASSWWELFDSILN